MKSLVFCTAVLLVIVQYVSGETQPAAGARGEFQCYQCDNLNNKVGCGHGSDVDRKFIRPCKNATGSSDEVDMYLPPGKEFHLCRKIVTVIDFDVNTNKATERIKRTCGYESSIYDELCYYRTGPSGRVTVCTCKGTECNHGTNIMPTTTFGLCLAIFAVVISLNINEMCQFELIRRRRFGDVEDNNVKNVIIHIIQTI